jgi:hypothetical protein
LHSISCISSFQPVAFATLHIPTIVAHRASTKMAANTPKTVCIIGAGPAGLVAAKALLQNGNYNVTVYEAANGTGGMWRALPRQYGDKCDPNMPTNLSRFTVAFSDLSWSSVDLSDPVTGALSPATPPMFPKAWQVGRYLRTYAQKFGVDSKIFFNMKVLHTKFDYNRSKWEVEILDKIANFRAILLYDHLVVASGFFDQPIARNYMGYNCKTFNPGQIDDTSRNYQHSSQFRTLSGLTDKPGKIVVIGGGISGSEAAAQVAMQISSAKHSPGTKPAHANSRVYHIVNRPFYAMPRYLPQDPVTPGSALNLAPSFLPLDLVLYNLTRRGGGEISASITTVPPEKAKKGHEFLRSVIGSDQADLGHTALVYGDNLVQYPAYTGITDTYSEFVRSGLIVPVQGWVDDVQDHSSGGMEVSMLPKAPWKHWSKEDGTVRIRRELASMTLKLTLLQPRRTQLVATAIIEATGYTSSHHFLVCPSDPGQVRQRAQYDEECPRIPLLLSRGSVFVEHMPTMAFVGFYEGPYWSVMEQQARLIAETWTTEAQTYMPRSHSDSIFKQDDAENMRAAMKAKSLQVPQFWQAGYVGLVEEFARHNNITRNDIIFGSGAGPAFSARYCSDVADTEAMSVINEVASIIGASKTEAKFVAAAVFRSMQGVWTLSRTISSRKASMPGGTFNGSAHFHPRFPTDAAFASEYLYIEEGTLTLDSGASFPASRRYIYRYNEVTDKISAWFADEDGVGVGALFNTWVFERPTGQFEGWVARGEHWCEPDNYTNLCEFKFRGAAIQEFGIRYEVEGPSKDYSHQSRYVRHAVE